MNKSCFVQAALCGMALACNAWPADLNRCRDPQGHILLTDQPCAEQGMQPDEVITATVAPVTGIPLSGFTAPAVGSGAEVGPDGRSFADRSDVQAPAVEPKRSPWAVLRRPLPHRGASLDAITLQAARNSILMDDAMRRQRKVASAH